MKRHAALLVVALAIPGVHAQTPIPPKEVGKAAAVSTFGGTGAFFRIDKPQGTKVTLPLKAEDHSFLEPASLRAFRLRGEKWELVPESGYEAAKHVMTVAVPGPGIYTVFGASRVREIVDVQLAGCKGLTLGTMLPKICTQILCNGGDFSPIAGSLAGDVPFPISPGSLGGQMNGICGQCLKPQPIGPAFPECGLPTFQKPELPWVVFPWPFRPYCTDASNGCVPGPHLVGRQDYNFENEFDLTPAGSTVPAYPGVDVRATLRYPATAAGLGQPVAGTSRYPMVLFLHGNHATCPCSCSHTCAAADRIPNHLGYNYLLDMLASWGFIAVSIDAFDVTCAGSFAMSDYEARGRLVLRHLEKWKSWDSAGGDPWGGLFKNRVDMTRIGLSGHSRGGEGVVAAEFINRAESLGYAIKAVNAIAPTDQDPSVRYVPQVPYFLLLGASDGDVSNLQGLRTYDRASLASTPAQSEKEMLWVHGANHNFFNAVWSPSSGAACAGDDGTGNGRLADSLQRLVACQSIVPFFRLHLTGETGYRKLFRGESPVEGLDGVRMYWAYQDPVRKEVDNFDAGDNRATNSVGGAVTASAGFSTFDEYEFKPSGPDTFNASFYHFTHGLVLGWNSDQTYRTTLPVGQRDISAYTVLAMRVSQVIDALNPVNTPRTFRVSLRTTGGDVSNADFDTAGIQSIPYPYEQNGGKTVLTTIRVPLAGFRKGNAPMPLTDIESVALDFRGTGLLAIDDIQFSK